MMNDDFEEETGPVGFMGKLRGLKVITWLLIIGLVALTVGGTSVLFILLPQ
ncbi:MAG: hypothetical protein ACOH1J_05695 [Microbacteriaceae bacterium]